jgi:hypothetical protein
MSASHDFGALLAQWDDARLVTDYLRRLSPEKRREALAPHSALGDRLRQAWRKYLDWRERNRKFFEREEARRQRRAALHAAARRKRDDMR